MTNRVHHVRCLKYLFLVLRSCITFAIRRLPCASPGLSCRTLFHSEKHLPLRMGYVKLSEASRGFDIHSGVEIGLSRL